MSTRMSPCRLAAILFAAGAPLVQAQTAQSANANTAVQITQARRANAALMQQYTWDSRTELLEDGTVKDTRVELVNYTNGQLQKSLISDQGPSLPRFGLRKQIAESKQKDMQNYLAGLKKVLEQYTLSSAGKVLDFMDQAQATLDPSGLLRMTGQNVVSPGDSFSVWADPVTRQTRRIQVSTSYDGDPITLNATFQTLSSGLNFMNYADVEVPAKQLSVQVSNFNYNRNN
jgi:hypothetical protein